MKNEITFIQCSRATISNSQHNVCWICRKYENHDRVCKPCGHSRYSEEEIEMCSDGEMHNERERETQKERKKQEFVALHHTGPMSWYALDGIHLSDLFFPVHVSTVNKIITILWTVLRPLATELT